MKIAVVTNSLNDELCKISQEFYAQLPYKKIVVSGKDGLHNAAFINHVIRNPLKYDFDWMIYVDEDCFITNQQALEDLIQYQIVNNYACSGVPDGGVISHRFHNPIAINPFFMIMNIGEIRKKYNIEEIWSSQYAQDLDRFIPTGLIKKDFIYQSDYDKTIAKGYKPFGVIYDNFEACYGFFFWLLRNNFKMLYLAADEYSDNLTTIVKNQNGVSFVYHTWFARKWHDENNKKRIMKIVDYCNKIKI
jgi:hypothetical protein